jgi:hypothetical protein
LNRQQEAFKYSVKAADNFIANESYLEALGYARIAFEIITKIDTTTDKLDFEDLTQNEYDKLFKVISCALSEMSGGQIGRSAKKFAFRKFNKRSADATYQGFLELELELEVSMLSFLEGQRRAASSSKKKKRLEEEKNRRYAPGGGQLNDWEPSFSDAQLRDDLISQKSRIKVTAPRSSCAVM